MRKVLFALAGLALLSCIARETKAQERNDATTAKIAKLLASRYSDGVKGQRKFIYNPIDLNDDRKNEYLVGLTSSEFCGNAGCKMLVLSSKFDVITSITLANYPVFVGAPGGKETTKGFSNLYMWAKGKGYVKLMWNGRTYPTNPSLAPQVKESVVEGKYKFLNETEDPSFNF